MDPTRNIRYVCVINICKEHRTNSNIYISLYNVHTTTLTSILCVFALEVNRGRGTSGRVAGARNCVFYLKVIDIKM